MNFITEISLLWRKIGRSNQIDATALFLSTRWDLQ